MAYNTPQNLTTSQEAAAGVLTGTELVRIVQDGANARTSIQEIADLATLGFTPAGDITQTTWQTNGIRLITGGGTLTDTNATGTISNAYTSLFGTDAIAATNTITFTNYYSVWVAQATAGTHVTITNAWALGAASLNITGISKLDGALTLGAALTYGGITLTNSVTGTGKMVLATSPTLTTPTLGVAIATSLALGGATIGSNGLAVTGTVNISGQITSTLAIGTAPFVVTSTTNVANLNASTLSGATFAAPGPIGSGTPNTGAFSTLSASGTLSGAGVTAYFASPPTIGGTAPGAGHFTTLEITGALTYGGVTLSAAVTGTGNMVLHTSATLVTPTLGVAKATSLAIGTVVADTLLNVNANTLASSIAPPNGTNVHIIGADTIPNGITEESFGNNSIFVYRRSNGTSASPTAIASGDLLGAFSFQGYYTSGGTGYSLNSAAIRAYAAENFTSSATGANIRFLTNAIGTTGSPTLRMYIASGISIGSAGTDPGVGSLSLTGEIFTAASTTTNAGLNLPHGAAPTSPVNGDIWTTTSGIYVRINGSTVGPLS